MKKIIIKKSADDQFYFVVTAKNGRVILTSETYKRRKGAITGIESIFGPLKYYAADKYAVLQSNSEFEIIDSTK